MTDEAVDLFAGPGGWDVGARLRGLTDPLGIELDADACATRKAAGLRTLQADVTELDPADFGPVRGLIASPPCTAFSNAGDRLGLHDIPLIYEGMKALLAGEDKRAELREKCLDKTSLLVLEPLRWALTLEPEWIACEQVPPVLPLWQALAAGLRDRGYSSWAGVLNAADYGVPQVRKRAFLIASRTKAVVPPEPTHGEGGGDTLFGSLEPWVSMAEALGWRRDGRTLRTGMNTMKHSRDPQDMVPYERGIDQPAPTVDGKAGSAWKVANPDDHVDPPQRWKVGFPRRADTPSNEAGDRVIEIDGTEYRERDLFPDDGPAPTLTEKARSWQRFPEEGVKLNPGKTDAQPNRRLYDAETEPAPTLAFGNDAAGWAWERPAPTIVSSRRSEDGGLVGRQLPEGEGKNVGGKNWPTHLDTRQSNAVARPVDEPAPTLASANLAKGATVWTDDPALEPTTGTGYKPTTGIRISLEEAAVLQGFPSGYPWQGTKSARFRQVGNAVPPPLASAVLSSLV